MHPVNTRIRRHIPRSVIAAAAAIGALALPASALASGVGITLHAPGHTMPINKTWKYTVDVTHNGKPVSGEVRYEFLIPILGNKAMGIQKWQTVKKGVYHGTMKPWTNVETKLAEGLTLTLEVQAKTAYGDASTQYKVKIEK